MNVLVHISEVPEQMNATMFEQLLKFVSATKARKIKRYIRRRDALRALIADTLARSMLCEQLGVPNNALMFSNNEYGKPHVVNYDIEYNVSHSGRWVVCAVSRNEIGVDVQRIGSSRLEIGTRWFAPEEQSALSAFSKNQRQQLFYKVWTLKESYIKAVGKGLSIPLDSFSLRIRGDEHIALYYSKESTDYYFKLLPLDPTYYLAICLRGDKPETFVQKRALRIIKDVLDIYSV